MVRVGLLVLRWAIRLRELSEMLWEHRAFGFVFVLPCALICAYWVYKIPAPGYAIAVMGIAAAIMAARTKASGYEKAAWMLVMFGLLFVETRAIRKDRTDNELKRVQAEKELKENFHDIGEGIRASISESDRNFNATIGKTNQVLANITGGDSFAYVSPQNFSGDQFAGVVWNNGEQALSGLSLTIAHTSEENWGAAFFQPIFIGTLGPYAYAPIPNFLFRPKADPKTGQDNYWIMLSAQNGTVSQSLYFRRDHKNPSQWAYAFQVSKQGFGKPQRRKMMTKLMEEDVKPRKIPPGKVLLYRAWSDDLAASAPKH